MKNIIRQIKENRLPEAFLIRMLKGMTIVDKDCLKNITCYQYNGNIIIEHRNDENPYMVSISDTYIRRVFVERFVAVYGECDSNYIAIDNRIRRLLKEYLNIGEIEYLNTFQTSMYDVLMKIFKTPVI